MNSLVTRIFLLLYFITQTCITQTCYAQSKQDTQEPYSWDFGQVKEGVVLRHNFEFKNESEKTINIKDVTTSCGCTASKVKKKTLFPGETTLIQVKFNSKGYAGPVKQYVYVHTDSLDNPVIRFIIKAEVAKE